MSLNIHGSRLGWMAAGTITICAQASGACAQPTATLLLDLPAQPLEQSLRDVSLRTGVSVIAPAELVDGRSAPALRGQHSARSAVDALVAGSGLAVRVVDGALVITAGERAEALAADEAEDVEGQELVVTGTNLRGAEPASPLITITRRDIDRTGATSVDQLLRILPQNTQGGVNKENSNVVLPDQDGTDHGAGLNLRGLGQRATLVLVNGRRLAPSGGGSFVDVSLIPVTALERVEILTDGASAIYGSDAVGGVVNFILRDRFDGVEASVQGGAATRGGGEQLQASLAGGRDWGSGNGLLAYEYRLENEILTGERDFTIGLRPGAFLFPRERRHSLLGMLDQQLAPGLRVGLSGTYARRTTRRTYFQTVSPLPVGVEAEAESLSLAGEIGYELPDGWLLRLDGNYGLSTSFQEQTQPGGQELINARDVRNAILEFGARLDGPLFELPGGSIRLAIGALTRSEEYRDGFASSAFARSVDAADRTVRSAFGELLVPLVSSRNRIPGLERLELSAAVRYDHYSRTGSTVDPKLGLVWSPARGLLLRGSYSTSFRAPLLTEVVGDYNVIYFPAFLLYTRPSEAPPGSTALFLQGNNPDVRPETSRAWTVGGEWEPAFAPGLRLTANYYSIRFADRIALPTPFVVVIGNPAFEPIVDRTPDLAQVTDLVAGAEAVLDFTGPNFRPGNAMPADVDIILDGRVSNTTRTTTRGFDIGLRQAFTLGANSFVAELNANHILDFQDQFTAASSIVNGVDRPYRPLDWRLRGGLGWSRGGWTGSLFVNHAGGYVDDRAVVRRSVSDHSTIDASLAFAFTRPGSVLNGTRLSLFVENLLDADPPRLVPDPGRTTGLGYDPVNASARGRYLALQLRRSF
jgi:outer membrane receptor protein involved in Fe transport